MKKRGYRHIKEMETEIQKMREEGRTRQEIADALGLEKSQVKNWINRHNRKQTRIAAGLPPKRRGRPRKGEAKNIEEYKYEIEWLKMENKLLRDFLQSTEKR